MEVNKLSLQNRSEASLDGEEEVLGRWREYFELQNIEEEREAMISCIGQKYNLFKE